MSLGVDEGGSSRSRARAPVEWTDGGAVGVVHAPCADMSCAVAADSVAASSAARADARAIVTPRRKPRAPGRVAVLAALDGRRDARRARFAETDRRGASARRRERLREGHRARRSRRLTWRSLARRRRPRRLWPDTPPRRDGSQSEKTSEKERMRRQSGDFCAADAWFARIAEELLPRKTRHAVCAATTYPTV